MNDAIRGFWVATATPLAADGTVDTALLLPHVDSLFRRTADGVVLFGTSGEGTSFSAAERLRAAEALLRHGVPADRIALGIGFPALDDTVALGREALKLGLYQLLVLPPYFYHDAPAAGLEAGYARVFERIGRAEARYTLYHIPQVSGVAVPFEVPGHLRARFGAMMAGVKDSSGEFAQFRAFRAASPDVAVCVGNETDIARARAEGGVGTICGMGNVVPGLVRAMFGSPDAEGPMRQALDVLKGPFVPAMRAILAAQIGCDAWRIPALPLLPADKAYGEAAARAIAQWEPAGG